MPEGLNSDLNLNVGAPPRVRPGMGEWGPQEVPTTRQKRRMRHRQGQRLRRCRVTPLLAAKPAERDK